MIKYDNGGLLIEDRSEIPCLPSTINKLYLDFETTSGHDKLDSLNPWHHCHILGIAFAFDDSPAWYLPLRCRNSGDIHRNTNPHIGNRLASDLLKRANHWINHNVKYDMHVAAISGQVKFEKLSHLEIRDTLTLAKLIDSDRWEYSLESLVRDWLHRDVSTFAAEFKPYLKHPGGHTKCRDYGVIPTHYMAPYACQDVMDVRDLFSYCSQRLESPAVWRVEQQLTRVLFDMEQQGLLIEAKKAFYDNHQHIPKILDQCVQGIKDVTGYTIEPHKNTDCYDILVGYYGLPILEWTKGSKDKAPEPSFGADALEAYDKIAGEHLEVVELIEIYRKVFKLRTGFVNPYIELCTGTPPRLHCSYNQCVRTGRMSCSTPNMQQLSKEAKEYIICPEGYSLIDFDLKQIEYRIIAHYIQNLQLLTEYQNNAKADYHTTMATLCQISRQEAKRMNFGVSFGAGKAKTIEMLRTALDKTNVPEGVDFDTYCQEEGLRIYDTYHATLPELKQTAYRASGTLRMRGFVKNHFGRIRNMPRRFHFKAFNNVIQSSAADFMKAVTLDIVNALKSYDDTHLVAMVHDSWLVQTPNEFVDDVVKDVEHIVENYPHNFRVPTYASYGISRKNWRDTDPDERGRDWVGETLRDGRLVRERGNAA